MYKFCVFMLERSEMLILHFWYLAILSGITTHSPVFYASLGRLTPLLIQPVNITSPFLPSVDLLRPYCRARPTPILTLDRSLITCTHASQMSGTSITPYGCILDVWHLDQRMHCGCPPPQNPRMDASRMSGTSITTHGCIADVCDPR